MFLIALAITSVPRVILLNTNVLRITINIINIASAESVITMVWVNLLFIPANLTSISECVTVLVTVLNELNTLETV